MIPFIKSFFIYSVTAVAFWVCFPVNLCSADETIFWSCMDHYYVLMMTFGHDQNLVRWLTLVLRAIRMQPCCPNINNKFFYCQPSRHSHIFFLNTWLSELRSGEVLLTHDFFVINFWNRNPNCFCKHFANVAKVYVYFCFSQDSPYSWCNVLPIHIRYYISYGTFFVIV